MKKMGIILLFGLFVLGAIILRPFDIGTSDEEQGKGKIKERTKEITDRKSSESKELSDADIGKFDQSIGELERKWDHSIEDLFLKELKLSKVDYQDYQVMRKAFDEDRLEAFKSFHKSKAATRYSPSQEMEENEARIKEQYRKLFKERFGKEVYAHYITRLEKFNDEARKNSDPESGVFYIEY